MSLIEHRVAARIAAIEQSGLDTAQNGLAALTQQVERTLESVTTLHILGAMLHAEGAREATVQMDIIQSYLVEVTAGRRFAALQLAIIDKEGRLEWSTVPGFQRVDLSDREHFRVHRDGRHEPFISAPLVGRASGQWSVQFTRPLYDRSGRFDGVVVASLDPMDLSQDFGALRLSPGMLASLLREDGTLLARSQDPTRFIGTKVPQNQLHNMTVALDAAADRVATYAGPSSSGEARIWAVRRIARWPARIAVGIDPQPDLAAAERRRRELQVILLIGIGLAFGFGMLFDAQRARSAARREAERAEASRREMQELLEALPGATYRGALAKDGSWLRLQVSSGLRGLFECEAPESRFAERIMHDAVRSPAERAAFRSQILTTGEAVAEYLVQLPTGATAWVRDQARLVDGRGPQAIEIVGILSDITEERQVKAKAIAGAKLATLGEMATGVAHELSQPCAAIGLAADVALIDLRRLGPGVVERVCKRLDDIVRQTARMREIIDHFRIFSRSDAPPEDRFAPAAAVDGALAVVRGTLAASGVRVELDVEPGLPLVRGSLVPFEQVLVNLLINARDAMAASPPAERRVQVTARRRRDAGRVMIEVRDFGPGLPESVIHRVFEPFFTTKPAGEGTGLGLAIAYGTVRSAQGTIDIANHPDGGAVVTLLLQPDMELDRVRDTAQSAS